jgi:NAD(P)-dependent dehydrogenase (short-subunit alcohol dehydrogenase family)|tara:strand:- start:2634 stop:3362 length:729 start_codon:yes stop_codon:yes gene_type:complete
MNGFEDKTAIVTGAGKGIGRATALDLANRGAKIIAFARTKADLDQLSNEIGSTSIVVDLSDTNSARKAMQSAGTADYLVNCAGTNVLQSVLDMTEDAYELIMGINLRAALICAQEFARARVTAGGGGAIVNVTSIAGHRGFEDHVVYAASKAGLDGATRVMAKELGPHGIRVNAVAPTITMTELAAEAWSDPSKKDPMMVRHPLGRFAEVEDVAKTIAMLLSEDAPVVTGSILPVDCGFLAV